MTISTAPLAAGLALALAVPIAGCSRSAVQPDGGAGPLAQTSVAAGAPASPDEILLARLRAASSGAEQFQGERDIDVSSWGASPASTAPPRIRTEPVSVSGRLPPEVIQRIVRQNFGRFRLCYENGLRKDPKLGGKVAVTFVIQADGSVSSPTSGGDLASPDVKACIVKAIGRLSFPQPEGGTVKVTYPLVFSPTGAPPLPALGSPPPSEPIALAPPPPPPAVPPPAALPSAALPSGSNPSDDRPPIVVIHDPAILLAGVVVGEGRSIEELGRLQKVDGLYAALKALREGWKARHHDEPFPGVAGIQADTGTRLIVLKSVFQTIAFAGYPEIYIQAPSDPSMIFHFAAQIPGPPPPQDEAPADPPPVARLLVSAADTRLTWKRGATVIAEQTIQGDDALATALCKDWKAQGRHRDPSDAKRDALILYGDNMLPLQALTAAARAAEACTRPLQGANGSVQQVPVFWITLSVH
jgi:hypothetical protein